MNSEAPHGVVKNLGSSDATGCLRWPPHCASGGQPATCYLEPVTFQAARSPLYLRVCHGHLLAAWRCFDPGLPWCLTLAHGVGMLCALVVCALVLLGGGGHAAHGCAEWQHCNSRNDTLTTTRSRVQDPAARTATTKHNAKGVLTCTRLHSMHEVLTTRTCRATAPTQCNTKQDLRHIKNKLDHDTWHVTMRMASGHAPCDVDDNCPACNHSSATPVQCARVCLE